jgi:hypothetical protein
MYETYFLQNWLWRWNQTLIQLRFINKCLASSGWCASECWFAMASWLCFYFGEWAGCQTNSLGTCNGEGRHISLKWAPQLGLSAGRAHALQTHCHSLNKMDFFFGTSKTPTATNKNESMKSEELRIQRALSTRRSRAAHIFSSFV